jgi:hypothetical protein
VHLDVRKQDSELNSEKEIEVMFRPCGVDNFTEEETIAQ